MPDSPLDANLAPATARRLAAFVAAQAAAPDWGDVDPDTHDRNDNALANGGCLRSAYRLPGADDALVVTTDAERSHTTAALASQHRPSQ